MSSCNNSEELRTAVVRVIGGSYANAIITIAAGTVVSAVGIGAGAAVCVGTVGTGCPAVASAAVAIVTIVANADVATGGLFLPAPKEIAYIGMPEKNVEVELQGTIWEPYYQAGNLRGGPQAHLPDPAKEQACFDLVQGKVAWKRYGSTTWNESNVRSLCAGTTIPSARVSCFERGIATHDDWSRAIQECKK